ncbi:MAG: hypothetical protein JRE12_08710 [Deltaproteobacteria bacterium]|nr:hypothetical protein [Deltaproteobacteria bacterium]
MEKQNYRIDSAEILNEMCLSICKLQGIGGLFSTAFATERQFTDQESNGISLILNGIADEIQATKNKIESIGMKSAPQDAETS